MKPITPDEYNAVVEEWKQWQSYPWGKLLYTISRFNIQRHLDDGHLHDSPIRILDVGGGNGFNSIYYARLGHSVALLDYSPAMLSNAREAAEKEGLQDRITFYQADIRDALHIFQDEPFDLIICHLMIEFVPEPVDALKGICELIAPGGLLSILDGNRYSEVYRKVFQANDLQAASSVIGTKVYFHPWFDRMTPLYSSAEMSEILRANGCEVVGDYGIRCVCDYIPNELKFEAEYYQALEQLELRLTDTYPYKLLARFYQLIMQK